MNYENITRAVFLRRPNRFIAEVEIEGHKEIVHVKNTGRCKELLVPGCEVYLTAPGTKGRKTKFDLVAVRKANGILFNIDSQAPNKVVKEWLAGQGFDKVIPEYTFGNSRLDFYMERQFAAKESKVQFAVKESETLYAAKESKVQFAAKESETLFAAKESKAQFAVMESRVQLAAEKSEQQSAAEEPERYLMEVKGCTLEIDGIGYFPDAPTERGVKHIGELIRAKREGYQAILAFVIQMDGVKEVRPNTDTHPEFGAALQKAKDAGVNILFLPCHVRPDSLQIVMVIKWLENV